MTPTMPYRDLSYVAAQRFEELRRRHVRALGDPVALREVYARRIARTVAGIVGALSGAGLLAYALAAGTDLAIWPSRFSTNGAATVWLVASGALFLVGYAAARSLARGAFDQRVSSLLARTALPVDDLARLEATNPPRLVVGVVTRLEWRSVAAPLVAFALLAPLMLHFAVGGLGSTLIGSGLKAAEFDRWITLSAFITGPAHVVLAICGLRFATKLRRRSHSELSSGFRGDWGRAVGWTSLITVIPWIALYLIPPMLVFVTGLVLGPLTFVGMGRAIKRERERIEAVSLRAQAEGV